MNLPITISVTISADGRLSMTGPLEDKITCLGLLEAAKDVVRSYDASKVLAVQNMPDALRALGKGE